MIASLPLEAGRLTQAQAQSYWDDGYLFPVPVLDPAEAAQMRAELEAIERDWLDAGLPQPLLAYKRVNAHVVMPLACRIASHPAILDVIEGILGPDILIYGAEFFIKEARSTQIVTMHQDLTYWGLGAIDGMVTAWVALSPSTRASGGMDFVRASHKNPILPHADTFSRQQPAQSRPGDPGRGSPRRPRAGGNPSRPDVAAPRADHPWLGAEHLGRPPHRLRDPLRHPLGGAGTGRARLCDAGARRGPAGAFHPCAAADRACSPPRRWRSTTRCARPRRRS